MHGTHVIHRRRSDDHERADDKRAVHIREGQPQVCLQALLSLRAELMHFPFLAAESVDHANRAKTLLSLPEDRAFLLLNEC